MKVSVLQQRHPDFDGDELRENRALYEGGKAWHELVATWLPKYPEEMADSWSSRKALALYTNHVGPICGLLSASVFTEAPAVDGLGDWYSDFAKNVDREGTTLQEWGAERLADALVEQRVFAWVNLPSRPDDVEVASRGDEERLGLLSAFLVTFTAKDVHNWEIDKDGRIAWILVHDIVHEQPDPTERRRTLHRWTAIDRLRIRQWTWETKEGREHPGDDDEADETKNVVHGIGELPVACLSLKAPLYAMGKLRDPAVAHARARNNLSWSLDRAAHALLTIREEAPSGDRPTLGPGYFLRLGMNDSAEYVEPSGANTQLLADDVVALREELYRVVHQMSVGVDSKSSRQRASGDAKALDWKAMEIVLSALAERVRVFLVDVLRLVGKARGEADAAPVVKGLDGWQEEDLVVWLQAAALAIDAASMSPTFRKEIAKRQAARLLQGADPEVLETVNDEIEDAEVDVAPYMAPVQRNR